MTISRRARRIRLFFSKQRIRDDILNEVASLFIAFPDAPESEDEAVNAALASLGETTRAMVGDVTNKDSGPVLAWKLVSVFCRVHGLKTSIALLQELARAMTVLHFFMRLSAKNLNLDKSLILCAQTLMIKRCATIFMLLLKI